MSNLNRQEDNEIRKMIYSFDIEGIEKRIRKYRFGKYICITLFLTVSGYFLALKIKEDYPIDLIALLIPLLVAGGFWWKEKDLIKAVEIMTAPEPIERQNQPVRDNA